MALFSFIDSLNCVFPIKTKKKKKKEMEEDLKEKSSMYKDIKINIIPTPNNLKIHNLVFNNENLDKWNVFIIGNDKTYILAHIGDPFYDNTNISIQGTKGEKLSEDISYFFNKVWTYTLNSYELQFLAFIGNKMFLINTFCFRTKYKKKIIGAIMLMRSYDQNVPNSKYKFDNDNSGDTSDTDNDTIHGSTKASSISSDPVGLPTMFRKKLFNDKLLFH